MGAQPAGAKLPQSLRARLHDLAGDRRHARGGRAGARRERENMQMREPAFLDKIERAREHVIGLGGKACDKISAEHDVGPRFAKIAAKGDGILA